MTMAGLERWPSEWACRRGEIHSVSTAYDLYDGAHCLAGCSECIARLDGHQCCFRRIFNSPAGPPEHRDWRWCGAIVLLSGHAIINNFKFGQAYLALMLSVILFMLDWKGENKISRRSGWV